MAEWQQTVAPSTVAGPIPSSLLFQFVATFSPYGTGGGIWDEFYTAADVGHTFHAPPADLDLLDDPFTSSDVVFGGFIGPGAQGSIGTLSQWLAHQDGHMGVTYTQYVPILKNYPVTDITRTIDNLLLVELVSDHFQFGGTQTIRLYSELVPEPSATTFSLIGTLLILHRRPTRPTCQCRPRSCRCQSWNSN